ncbi:MAG: hypothetical protein ACK5MQ_02055 [Pikeienuella sp.]
MRKAPKLLLSGVVLALLGGCMPAGYAPDPLFSLPPASEVPPEDAALAAFRDFARTHPEAVGLTGDVEAALAEVTTGPPPFRNRRIGVLRLAQTYRGLPVRKGRADIVLITREGAEVLRLRGALLDQSADYSGLTDRISATKARRAMARHWAETVGGRGFRVGPARLAALPELRRIAYVGEITTPFASSSRVIEGTVLIDAATGDPIAIEDRPVEARALVAQIDDDPRNMNLVFRDGLPTETLGNVIDFSDPPGIDCNPIGWRPARLGDATRQAVVSFEGTDGSAVAHFEGVACVSGGGVADFAGGAPGPATRLNDQLLAQDEFAKTRLAIALIDPLMGEMFSHGSEHPYSWDHHPSTPDIAHRAPLLNVVNASAAWFNDQPGIFRFVKLSEADADALDLPAPHPLVFHCRDGSNAQVACDDPAADGPAFQYMSLLGARAAPPFHTRTLFHEIGHYYDNFNDYGVSGDNAEIVAQLFALYLHRRIYDLDYRITGNADVECSLSALVSHSAGVVVDPTCVADLNQISGEIDFDGPYTVRSFTQAWWSLLFGVSCTLSGGALICDQPGALAADYPDRWMEALLFALQTGNDLEPVELWDAMALFIDANYPQENARLATVRALHGLD